MSNNKKVTSSRLPVATDTLSGQRDSDNPANNKKDNTDGLGTSSRVLEAGPDDLESQRFYPPFTPPPVAISGRTSDRPTLLAFMYVRFREKKHTFSYSSTFYRRLDTFLFFVPLMALQCSVAVVYVAANSNEDFQRIFSGCVSAVSALLIAIQMRMKWGEKAERFQAGARQYALLASETFFKWLTASSMNENEFRDFVKDAGQLEKEIQDTAPVPPAWVTTKFEQHRLQLTVSSDSEAQMAPVNLVDGRSNNKNKKSSEADDDKQPRRLFTRRSSPSNSKNNNPAPAGYDVTDNFPPMLRNLPPPNDLDPPPAELFPARSRLRMSRPGGPSIEMSPIPENRPYLPSNNNNNEQQQSQTTSPDEQSTATNINRGDYETSSDPAERVPFIDGPSTSSASDSGGGDNNRSDFRLQRSAFATQARK